jgi:hypothetical protein
LLSAEAARLRGGAAAQPHSRTAAQPHSRCRDHTKFAIGEAEASILMPKLERQRLC